MKNKPSATMNRLSKHYATHELSPRVERDREQFDWYFEWKRDDNPATYWNRRNPDRPAKGRLVSRRAARR